MILSENHSIQISAILIEAAEEQGDKKGALTHIKEFLKKVISFVVEKIKKFTDFIKTQVQRIVYKIRRFKDRMAAKKKDVAPKDKPITAAAKKEEATARRNLNAKTQAMVKLLPQLKAFIKMADAENMEGAEKRLAGVKEAIDKIADQMAAMDEQFAKYTSSANRRERAFATVKEALAALSDVEKVASENAKITAEFVATLKEYKAKLETLVNKVEKQPEQKPSAISKVIAGLNGVVSKVSGFVSGTWAAILRVLSKIFSAFGKKDDEAKASEDTKEEAPKKEEAKK